MGHGVYTWSDGTVESGQYLEGQKHGAHTWSRGKERWEMVYEKGTLVTWCCFDVGVVFCWGSLRKSPTHEGNCMFVLIRSSNRRSG